MEHSSSEQQRRPASILEFSPALYGEPMRGRETTYRPYEAAPLSNDKQSSEHQDDVKEFFLDLITSELGDTTSQRAIEFVKRSISNRIDKRGGMNIGIFGRRLHENPNTNDPELLASCQRSLSGNGSVRDNDIARRLYGVPSVEYADLTIVNGRRQEHLRAMYDEVGELVDHDISHIVPHRVQIMGFDRDVFDPNERHIGAMRIEVKRDLGALDDQTVISQRSLAIIDMSPNFGANQEIVAELLGVLQANHSDKKDAAQPIPLSDLDDKEAPLTKLMIEHFINTEFAGAGVLARNETIYGHNKILNSLIHERLRGDMAMTALRASA